MSIRLYDTESEYMIATPGEYDFLFMIYSYNLSQNVFMYME